VGASEQIGVARPSISERCASTKLALMDHSIVIPSRSGTYVEATWRQLLDRDVARKSHCNENVDPKKSLQRRVASQQGTWLLPLGKRSRLCYQFVMSWTRNGSFPLIPSGLEITITLLSDNGRQTWITIKGEDQQTAERVANAITGLNLAPDLVAEGSVGRPIDEFGPQSR
jgi:hypothetical protein